MRLARYGDGCYLVPGARTEWVEIDGHGLVGVHVREIYQHADGTIEPGIIESPVRTELRLIQYPANEPHRYQPLVCAACGDSGDSQRHSFGPCEGCDGYGDERNLHRCVECGEYAAEVLPVAPRADQTHELLLKRAHVSCAIESLRDAGPVVRASAAA